MVLIKLDDGTTFCSISTFSGGGIGDAGVEWGAGVPVISACEVVPDRAGLIRHNYPDTKVFEDDIWDVKNKIIEHARKKVGKEGNPWLFVMSPPCQGMSANGAGRISASIAAGNRPKEDERNRLVLPGIDIIEELKPSWFILENVRRMENTVIQSELSDRKPEKILDVMGRRLHPLGYTIRSAIIDFRDLGVPHHRKRLITIGTNVKELVRKYHPGQIFHSSPTELHPQQTHGGDNQPKHIPLEDVIRHMPWLDAKEKLQCEEDPLHQIPKWNDDHYFWMKHTPMGCTAFENDDCLDQSCGKKEIDRRAYKCPECHEELPRPTVEFAGWTCLQCGEDNRKNKLECDRCGKVHSSEEIEDKRRLIRGFKTSYRRLKWKESASTITMNSGVISSDMKGHPEEHRVLSVKEILMLSTLHNSPAVTYPWGERYQFKSIMKKGENKKKKRYHHGGEMHPRLVRQVIGESIPPLAMQKIVEHLLFLDQRIDDGASN